MNKTKAVRSTNFYFSLFSLILQFFSKIYMMMYIGVHCNLFCHIPSMKFFSAQSISYSSTIVIFCQQNNHYFVILKI